MLVGRSEGKLKETMARLGAKQGIAHCVADATDEAAMAAVVEATAKAFGGIDILFANAGTEGLLKPIETYSRREFEEVVHTNVTGVWLAIKHCIEPMKKRGKGSIVATASVAGVVGFANSAPYIASKHAVCGLVKAAAMELSATAKEDVQVAPEKALTGRERIAMTYMDMPWASAREIAAKAGTKEAYTATVLSELRKARNGNGASAVRLRSGAAAACPSIRSTSRSAPGCRTVAGRSRTRSCCRSTRRPTRYRRRAASPTTRMMP